MVSEPRGAESPRSMGSETSAIPARTLLAVGVLALAIVLVGGSPLLAVAGYPHASVSVLARGDRQAGPAAPVGSGGSPSPPVGVGPSGLPSSPAGVPLGVVSTVQVGSAPVAIAYDSGKRELFVANSNSNNVSVIADGTGTVVATIAVGSFPYGITYDSGRNEVFVANTGSDNVSVISDVTNQVVATVSLSAGDWPAGIVYDSGIGAVFVANAGSDSIAEISESTNMVNNTLSTGAGSVPFGLAYDSGRGQIFATLRGSGSVALIVDTSLFMVTLPVGLTPSGVAYDAARGEIFVANNGSNTVSVIADVNDSLVATIPVGSNPFGIAYGPGTSEVAVTYLQLGSPTTFAMLAVIADVNNTVVARVGLYGGGSADAVAYDTGNGGWYVADTAVDFVVIVVVGSYGYEVTFTETGLPAGTAWQFWFNGTGPWGRTDNRYESGETSAHVTAGNGTYTFTILPVAGYAVSPASGSITVAGAPVSRAITFSFQYVVTFTENGLPAGTTWSVTLAGTSKSSTSTAISFSEGNGTYAFTLGSVSGYDASPSSGNVSVSGTAASKTVAFTPASSGTPGAGEGLFGLPGYTGLILIVVVIVAVVGGGFLLLRMRRRQVPPSSGSPPAEPGAPPS